MHDDDQGQKRGRTSYDRVLASVAATFLIVSATQAFAQAPKASASELAIEAAVPMPEPANVPPPTASDFAPPTTGAVAPAAVPAPAAPTAAITESATPSATAAAPATSPAPAPPVQDTAKQDAAKQDIAKPSSVAAADQPVADRLRDLMATKGARYFDRKNERAAVEKFYAARDYAPVWTASGKLTDSAKGVIKRLGQAGADGLDNADYPVPDFAAATTPDALAEAEFRLTESVLDYARQAQSGRMHWSQVSADILYPEHPTDPAEVLANVTGAKDASAALESYNPPHKGYRDLRAKLAELRGETATAHTPIAEGPALRYVAASKKKPAVVMEDERVPELRGRLGVAGAADDKRYDETLAAAVRKFQSNSSLNVTGVLDAATVKAMNAPKRDRLIDIVILNMERWRWLPRQLGASQIGNAYVILNVPDYTLKVMQNGAQVWTTRVVTGKPGKHATPMLTETMKYITVNPTWNVPPSIIYNEYLPALQQDPTVLQRMGLKLERNRDGSIHISQPPGEANALGRIRFNFPNKFLVYQHDTPDKHLFARDERAFSHGCMRVQNPDQYAATLLNITMPNEKYTPERIRAMYGRSEIDLKFPTPIPVNITYQTAFVDEAGKLQIRKDIYGRDAAMAAVLKGGKTRDLENVVAHAQPSYARPRADIPAGVAFSDNSGQRYASNGPNFFERLFGPPAAPPQVQDRRRRVFR
jgi:murein L,D-transpeptidase YcbB/YkuD